MAPVTTLVLSLAATLALASQGSDVPGTMQDYATCKETADAVIATAVKLGRPPVSFNEVKGELFEVKWPEGSFVCDRANPNRNHVYTARR